MKASIIGAFAVLTLVLVAICLFSITGRSTRQSELNTSLSNALEQTMKVMFLDKTYEIPDENTFLADFTGNLVMQFASDSDVEIRVMNLDLEKGLFDVEVIQHYRGFTGTEGAVTSRKTVILEQYKNPDDKFHMVTFQYTDGTVIKAYQVYHNSFMTDIKNKPEGFLNWQKIKEDGTVDEEWDGQINRTKVTEDIVFRAACAGREGRNGKI